MNWEFDKLGIVSIDTSTNVDKLLLDVSISNYDKIVLNYKISNTFYEIANTFRYTNRKQNLCNSLKYCEDGIKLLSECIDSIPILLYNDILQDFLLIKSNITPSYPNNILYWKLLHSVYLLNPKRFIESRDELIWFVNSCFINDCYDIPQYIFTNKYININIFDINYPNSTPFILEAVNSRDDKRIKFLLDNGADINIENNKSESALSVQIYKFFDNSEGGIDYDFDETIVNITTDLLLSKSIPNKTEREKFLEEILIVYEKYNVYDSDTDIDVNKKIIDTSWKNIYAKYTNPNKPEILDDYKYF